MGEFNYTHTCGRCAATLFTVTDGNAQAWKDDAAAGGHKSTCSCGCTYTTEDDGNPDGGVQAKDVSAPKITSINTASGPIAGGTTIRVNGSAFQVTGTSAVVKFGGLTAAPTVLSDTAIDAVTPAGKVRLIGSARQQVNHGAVTGGPFQVAETLTGGTSGATAIVKEVGAGYVLIDVVTGGPFQAGETLTGNISAATASFTDLVSRPFTNGETITGATSGATATMSDATMLWITAPSGPFTAGEEITGGSSGARAQLDNPTWYDGTVDVSAENGNGQRASGGVLLGAFQYTI